MKFLKSKFFIITVSVVLLLALITGILSLVGFSGPVKLVLGTLAKPFSWVGTYFADAVNGFVEVFTDYDELKAENEALRAELDALKDASYNSEVLEKENEWLKEYINLATDHPSFELTDARIIGRTADNYSTVLTLDRGTVHGVKVNMAVITSDGVFGHVVEVGLDYCRVQSIVETASSVGVYALRSGATGIVEGDADLREGGNCRMTYIDSEADIRIGDRIYTSGGAGSAYPSGLYVGEVTSLDADESTRQLIATVTPAVDFTDVTDIEKIMIITGYSVG
ncbi:MAG: rod shape-determining protein MreC [Clostridia bacterium]|nr:rod shape-determining protein MreC [Clostridia bacterium]